MEEVSRGQPPYQSIAVVVNVPHLFSIQVVSLVWYKIRPTTTECSRGSGGEDSGSAAFLNALISAYVYCRHKEEEKESDLKVNIRSHVHSNICHCIFEEYKYIVLLKNALMKYTCREVVVVSFIIIVRPGFWCYGIWSMPVSVGLTVVLCHTRFTLSSGVVLRASPVNLMVVRSVC